MYPYLKMMVCYDAKYWSLGLQTQLCNLSYGIDILNYCAHSIFSYVRVIVGCAQCALVRNFFFQIS
jgi:hypothetical protein